MAFITERSGVQRDTTAGSPEAFQRLTRPNLGDEALNALTTDPITIWQTQPAVRKVVSFAARNIASVSLHHFERASDGNRVRLNDSAVERLLRRPTKDRTRTRQGLLRDFVTDHLLYDRALILYSGGELLRISPERFELQSNWLGQLTGIFLRLPGQEEAIDVTRVPKALLVGAGPEAGGLSPMVTLSQVLAEGREAVAWRRSVWKNGVKITGILERPETSRQWNPKERERFITSWREWKSEQKAGGTPILEDGMTYRPMDTFKSEQVQDLEGRTLTDAEVATAYNIPPELLGVRETTYGNISAFLKMLYGPVLGPELKYVQSAFNTGLVPLVEGREDTYVEFDIEGAKTTSTVDAARERQTAVGAPFMTRAEARAELNLPKLQGTDELIQPLNVTAGEQVEIG